MNPWLGWVPPIATIAALVWAAWLALGSDTNVDAEDPADHVPPKASGALVLVRRFHIAHLTMLFLASVAASVTIRWWDAGGVELLLRLGLVLALVWIAGDLVPRVLSEVAPRFARTARRGAIHSLGVFTPLFGVAAWADRRGRSEQSAAERPPADHHGPTARGLFALADTMVSDVMTPRIDIVAVDQSATPAEVLETLGQSEYARLVVYDGTPDTVVGILYAKDLVGGAQTGEDSTVWQALIRSASFVPEGKRLDRQLQDFQRGHHHIAVVVDEHGGTAGIVTLEDILEEIVGEIQDEHDTDEVAEIQEVDTSTWLVEGGTPLADLEEVVGQDFGREDVSTVGGLVMAELGRVPSARESLHLAGCRLTVNQMVGRRVQRVLVHRLPAESDQEREAS